MSIPSNTFPLSQSHPLQVCPFLQAHGETVVRYLDEYHPFPSEDHRAARAARTSSSAQAISSIDWGSVIGGIARIWTRQTIVIANDQSTHIADFSTRTELHLTVNVEADAAAQAAKAKREKEEQEARNNNLVIAGAGAGSLGLGWLFGKRYQEYCEAQEKFDELVEKGEKILTEIPNQSGLNSVADEAAKRAVTDIFTKYEQFYAGQMRKVTGYAILTGTLCVELAVLAVSAFYKSFRIRNAMGATCFLTSLAGIVFYSMYRNIDSRERFNKIVTTQIKKIKDLVTESILSNPPPSYQQVRMDEACQRAGFTIPVTHNGGLWTQHMESGRWSWWEPGQGIWKECVYP